jgi:hypothetical protein
MGAYKRYKLQLKCIPYRHCAVHGASSLAGGLTSVVPKPSTVAPINARRLRSSLGNHILHSHTHNRRTMAAPSRARALLLPVALIALALAIAPHASAQRGNREDKNVSIALKLVSAANLTLGETPATVFAPSNKVSRPTHCIAQHACIQVFSRY